ncbi:MAG TPA: hypothetical protein DD473_02740, partial [Planctomycetaceae bacterium]|nr:hypothetical protein [Planctomycetaceae bacterium]
GSHRSKLEREKEIRHFDEYRTRNGKTYPRTIARDSREAKKLRKDASAVYGDLPEGSFRKINVEQIQRDVNREAVKKMELPSDNLTDDIEMLACDFREMEVEDESINAILTDPLYEGDALHLWSDLAEFAEKKLVDGGLLVAYTGIEFLPEVLERLTGELDYIWQRVVFFKGNKRSNCGPIRGGSGYRPILIFGKNRKQLEKGILDVIPSGDREKEWHPFQQSVSEAEHILNDMTSQGDLICDPFAGSFTTAIACHRTGRRFIGCDLDKDNLKVGKYRLLAEKGEVDPSNLPFPSKNEAVS